ncbi:MAG: TatD family hydrolase, partial [Bacteroidetes bacterium]|nr:TatD family hydrolase [Bacteroidota bacterium]
MIDTHCHIDLYPNPSKLILQTERDRIITILVTNLPSSFEIAYPHVKGFRYIRLALGLHPLFAHEYSVEKRLFEKYVDQTSYIGEVGLDFSSAGISTKEIQIESFKFVLKAIRNKPKFMSIHSRKAESEVLDGLEEENRSPVVFHWYSGPLKTLDRAI